MIKIANPERVTQDISKPIINIELYTLDCSVLGGPILRFSNTKDTNGNDIKFNGAAYPAINFKAEGFSWDSSSMPRPKITVSIADDNGNLPNTFLNIVVGYNGGQGASLYRIETLDRYLDGHEDGGSNTYLLSDRYIVDRVINLDNQSCTWELITPMDLSNLKLPSRQALVDVCGWIYRRYNSDTDDFEYYNTSTACPYAGDKYFTKMGVACTKAEDECGHRLNDCVLRFGEGAALPYGGFPGLARVRV